MKKIFFVIIALTIGLGLFAADTVKDFSLEDINGNKVKFSELLKKGPVLIDFWATWCTPCKKSMPHLDKIQRKYKDKLTILAVSVDKPRDKSKVISFVKKRFAFVTVLDSNQEVYKSMNAKVPPSSYLVNQKGEIVYSHVGYKKGDEKHIESEIKKLLGKDTKSHKE